MSRTALKNTNAIIIAGSVVFVVTIASIGSGIYVENSPSHKVTTSTNTQNQLTYVSYKGVDGQDALTLLKNHETVQTKHYSFGDLVTSINGTSGTGPKYWSFYVNGKLAAVGAGTYVTHKGDTIEWKLQKL